MSTHRCRRYTPVLVHKGTVQHHLVRPCGQGTPRWPRYTQVVRVHTQMARVHPGGYGYTQMAKVHPDGQGTGTGDLGVPRWLWVHPGDRGDTQGSGYSKVTMSKYPHYLINEKQSPSLSLRELSRDPRTKVIHPLYLKKTKVMYLRNKIRK